MSCNSIEIKTLLDAWSKFRELGSIVKETVRFRAFEDGTLFSRNVDKSSLDSKHDVSTKEEGFDKDHFNTKEEQEQWQTRHDMLLKARIGVLNVLGRSIESDIKNDAFMWILEENLGAALFFRRYTMKNVVHGVDSWWFAADFVASQNSPPIARCFGSEYFDCFLTDEGQARVGAIPVLPITQASLVDQMEMMRAMLYPKLIVFRI